MTALLVPETIVTAVGLLSLWTIWALRDRPDAEPAEGSLEPAEGR